VTILRFHNFPAKESQTHFPFNHMTAAILPRLSKHGKHLNAMGTGEFSDWYLDLLGGEPTLKEEDKALLKDQLQEAGGALDKVRILYDFVRKNIRYIASYEYADQSILPHAPSQVLEHRYGDCKDKAYLLATLARENGIKVNMVLLSTEPRPTFQGLHADLFDHVVCAYVGDGEHHFLDPTCKHCGFSTLPEKVIGASALLLDRESPERLVIPSPSRVTSLEVAIQVEMEDLENGRAKITLRNDFFTAASRAHSELQRIDLENLLSSLITESFNKILLSNFQYNSCGDDFMVFDARADISDFAISTTNKLYFPQIPFQIVDADVLDREGDDFALYTQDRPRAKLTIEIPLPDYDGKKQDRLLGSEETALFKASAILEGEEARLHYEIEQHAKRFKGEAKKGYIAFCRDYLKSKSKVFVFTRRAP